jgi:hypothetical protein
MRIRWILFLAWLAAAAQALSSCAPLSVRTEAPEGQAGTHASNGSRSACSGAPERSPSGVELFIDRVRNLDLPHWLSNKITYLEPSHGTALRDPRSRLADLSQIDQDTVVASELAYDVEEFVDDDLQSRGRLSDEAVQRELPGYEVAGIFVDTFSGFKAVAFESKTGDGNAHRIYAVAGTQVFENTDFRDWASGLMMAEPQFVSNATLLMIKNAAEYASDPAHGGEVLITGQSQGALDAQGIGYLLEEYLDAGGAPHRLVHVVSWGAAGAEEAIVTMIQRYRRGRSRGVWPPLERHWSYTEPDYQEVMQVWRDIRTQWQNLADDAIETHVGSVARQMRVVGFFFEIDPFARAGRFLGTAFVFPAKLMLPDRCEDLVVELLFRTKIGKLGVTLESHFLNGYRRAVTRGAIALARPAEPEKWPWVVDWLEKVRGAAKAWLADQYLDKLARSESNWRLCVQSREWMTDRNRMCRRSYWPGCAAPANDDTADTPFEKEAPHWCLITRGPGVQPSLESTEASPSSDPG